MYISCTCSSTEALTVFSYRNIVTEKYSFIFTSATSQRIEGGIIERIKTLHL